MPPDLPETMSGVLLTGHGGIEKLHYRTNLPLPSAGAGEVLVRLRASAINNTDINTRSGWYDESVVVATGEGGATGFGLSGGVSSAGGNAESSNDSSRKIGGVTSATSASSAAAHEASSSGSSSESSSSGSSVGNSGDSRTWSGEPLSFPFIQGADGCGEIVSVGAGVSASRIGERVLLCAMQYISETRNACLGSEMDGCYAQYVSIASSEAHVVSSRLTDRELAAIPCAYSTAEGLVSRAGVNGNDRVLITGASGGVGLAAVQLSRLRGAEVIALVGAGKGVAVCAAGASSAIERSVALRESLSDESVDVIIDLVGGDITQGGTWSDLLRVLRRGGRYAISGAIAGPIVSLDLRQLYLKDLRFYGCTAQGRDIFPRLIEYIAADKLHPVIASSFPLSEIHAAQRAFLKKDFIGKIVLLP